MRVSCSICSFLFDSYSTVVASPCGHVFHEDCISRWTTGHSQTCPQCRSRLSTDNIHKLYFHVEADTNSLDVCHLENAFHQSEAIVLLKEAKIGELERTNKSLSEQVEAYLNMSEQIRELMKHMKDDVVVLQKGAEDLKTLISQMGESALVVRKHYAELVVANNKLRQEMALMRTSGNTGSNGLRNQPTVPRMRLTRLVMSDLEKKKSNKKPPRNARISISASVRAKKRRVTSNKTPARNLPNSNEPRYVLRNSRVVW